MLSTAVSFLIQNSKPRPRHTLPRYMTALVQTTDEQWTEHELAEPTYHWLYECFSDEQQQDEQIQYEWAQAPELILTTDAAAAGNTMPMACGILVVKDIQGRACSRLLRVLFDSGGSKSMVHRRVVPRGSRLDQPENQTMMRTLAGVYADWTWTLIQQQVLAAQQPIHGGKPLR